MGLAQFMSHISTTISGTCAALLAILAVASLFVFAPVDLTTFYEAVVLRAGNPLATFAGAAALCCALFGVSRVIAGPDDDAQAQRRRAQAAVAVCAMLLVVLGVLWVCANPYEPFADQLNVWEFASMLAGIPVSVADMQELTDYLDCYPQQRRMALAFSLLFRLFHTNSLYVIWTLNVVCLACLLVSLCGLAWRLTQRPQVAVLCACATTLFAPLVLYTSFWYTTLISAALCFIAFYGLVAYLQEQRLFYLAAILLLPLSNLLYTGTIIATLAACVILIIHLFEQRRKERLAYPALASLVLLPLVFWGLTAISDHAIDSLYKPATSKGMPASAFLVMSLTSQPPTAACGAGSYDGQNYTLMYDNGFDADKTDQVARNEIARVVQQYATGERSLTFFAAKAGHQWLDPWFSSPCMTCYISGNQPNPTAINHLASAGVLDATHLLLTALLSAVYACAGVGALIQTTLKNHRASLLILEVFFILGFAFLMIWEQKPRYGLPYFLALIPLAALGIDYLGSCAKRYISVRAIHGRHARR